MKILFLIAILTTLAGVRAPGEPAKADRPVLSGGYSPAEIDSEVGNVAAFAVKSQAQAIGRSLRLVKILKAERQVVAGLNYRLEIEVADGSKKFAAHAVVSKKLDGSLALTSWE